MRLAAAKLPDGFIYRPEFISDEEERVLLEHIQALDFSEVRMHGVIAKRRVVHYGWLYAYESFRIAPGPAIPDFLLDVRARAAEFAGRGAGELAEALVTEYRPSAVIGWHRDAPPFGIVAAISLAGSCRFRFRRGEAGARETAEALVEPRSIYVLDGPARTEWQHSIPPTQELRYSVTFRTLRRKR